MTFAVQFFCISQKSTSPHACFAEIPRCLKVQEVNAVRSACLLRRILWIFKWIHYLDVLNLWLPSYACYGTAWYNLSSWCLLLSDYHFHVHLLRFKKLKSTSRMVMSASPSLLEKVAVRYPMSLGFHSSELQSASPRDSRISWIPYRKSKCIPIRCIQWGLTVTDNTFC